VDTVIAKFATTATSHTGDEARTFARQNVANIRTSPIIADFAGDAPDVLGQPLRFGPFRPMLEVSQ